MVENFTPQKDETCPDNLELLKEISNELIEEKIIVSLKDLVKEPSQEVIDTILNYSKSWSK